VSNLYAVHINVSHISTSPKARKCLPLPKATAKAASNLRYIQRKGAIDDPAQDIISRTNGKEMTGNDAKAAAREALAARAKKHTEKNGVRLADKLRVSLPADASIEQQREMARAVLDELTGDSSAFAIATIHGDTPRNKHLHIAAFDGLETVEAAKARKPDAKRVRRAEYMQLNEGGSRKELRARIARRINKIAERDGLRMAEHRSLKDQGISRVPQIHEGIEIQDKANRGAGLSKPAAARAAKNIYTIFDNNQTAGKQFMNNIPSRWKRGKKHLDMWANLLKEALARRAKRRAKAEAEKEQQRAKAIAQAQRLEAQRQVSLARREDRRAAYLNAAPPIPPKPSAAPPADPSGGPHNVREDKSPKKIGERKRFSPGEYNQNKTQSIRDLARVAHEAEQAELKLVNRKKRSKSGYAR
jgi:hypothetical protein